MQIPQQLPALALITIKNRDDLTTCVGTNKFIVKGFTVNSPTEYTLDVDFPAIPLLAPVFKFINSSASGNPFHAKWNLEVIDELNSCTYTYKLDDLLLQRVQTLDTEGYYEVLSINNPLAKTNGDHGCYAFDSCHDQLFAEYEAKVNAAPNDELPPFDNVFLINTAQGPIDIQGNAAGVSGWLALHDRGNFFLSANDLCSIYQIDGKYYILESAFNILAAE